MNWADWSNIAYMLMCVVFFVVVVFTAMNRHNKSNYEREGRRIIEDNDIAPTVSPTHDSGRE